MRELGVGERADVATGAGAAVLRSRERRDLLQGQSGALDNGVRVRLRDTPDIEHRTLELVAAESRCCAFLDFDLSRQDAELVLDISGPEDARPLIELFFEPQAA